MSDNQNQKPERYPLNADGPFYSVNGLCLCCMAPEDSAPQLMGFDQEKMHCYFKRQPETAAEVERAMTALLASQIEGLRYVGNDPLILEKLGDAPQLYDIYKASGTAIQEISVDVKDESQQPVSKCLVRRVIEFLSGAEQGTTHITMASSGAESGGSPKDNVHTGRSSQTLAASRSRR